MLRGPLIDVEELDVDKSDPPIGAKVVFPTPSGDFAERMCNFDINRHKDKKIWLLIQLPGAGKTRRILEVARERPLLFLEFTKLGDYSYEHHWAQEFSRQVKSLWRRCQSTAEAKARRMQFRILLRALYFVGFTILDVVRECELDSFRSFELSQEVLKSMDSIFWERVFKAALRFGHEGELCNEWDKQFKMTVGKLSDPVLAVDEVGEFITLQNRFLVSELEEVENWVKAPWDALGSQRTSCVYRVGSKEETRDHPWRPPLYEFFNTANHLVREFNLVQIFAGTTLRLTDILHADYSSLKTDHVAFAVPIRPISDAGVKRVLKDHCKQDIQNVRTSQWVGRPRHLFQFLVLPLIELQKAS